MKKVTSTKRWLWLVSVVAILIAMACMFTACGGDTEETQPTEIVPTELYWNLDKAIYTEGPCFLNILSPCPRGWRYETEDLAEICQLAVDTCVWPLYEIEDGMPILYYGKALLPMQEQS